jgi:transcriptional regulator with XRE-family HTH domain
MEIYSELTDDAVLAELGDRIRRTRLERNVAQGQLANQAGLSRSTVERLEAGEGGTLTSCVRVLRALGLLDALDRLVPEPTLSPIERVKLRGQERQRARPRISEDAPTQTWRWADEEETG